PVRRLRQLPMRIGQNADQRRYAIRIADVRERFHGGVPRFAGSPGVERQVRKIIAYGGTSSRLTLLSARCREGRAPHLLIAVDQALRDRYRAFTTGQLAEQACSPSADLRIRVGGTHD